MAIDSEGIYRDLAPLSRRGLLKSSVLTGIGLATLSTIGCSDSSSIASKQAPVFQHLASIMFPANDTLVAVADIPILENIDHLLSLFPQAVQGDLDVAVSLFDYGAIVLGWHFSRFNQLNESSAVAYVNEWQNGNELQRGIVTALKKLVYTAYWQDEKTWSAVHFDGPVSDKWGLKKLGNAPMPAV